MPAVHHTYVSGTYSGKKLHVILTPAKNICLYDLKGKQSIKASPYYGVNGGFFTSVAKTLAICDGVVLSNEPHSDWNGGAIIGWNGSYFRHYEGMSCAENTNINDDLKSGSGTWAQGGHAMHLGDPNWLTALYADVSQTPENVNPDFRDDIVESTRPRTGMVVDTVNKTVYLFVSSTSCTFEGFRAAVQAYFNIKDSGANTRYYGLFLDGGSSTQMKYSSDGSSATTIDPSGKNLKLFQIIALRDPT